MAVDVGTLQAKLTVDATNWTKAFASVQKDFVQATSVAVLFGNVASQAIQSATQAAKDFASFPVKAAIETGKWAEAMQFLNEKTGLSEEFLINMQPMLSKASLTADDVAVGFRHLSQNVAEAGDSGSKAGLLFERLKLNISDLKGDPERALLAISDAVKKLPAGFERTSDVGELLGNRLTRLIPLLVEGSEGFKKSAEQANNMALALSGPVRKELKELDDTLDLLSVSWDNYTHHVGAASSGMTKFFATLAISLLNDMAQEVDILSLRFDEFGKKVSAIWGNLKALDGQSPTFGNLFKAFQDGRSSVDDAAGSLKTFGPPIATAAQQADQLAKNMEQSKIHAQGLTKYAQDLREAMKPVALLKIDESFRQSEEAAKHQVALSNASLAAFTANEEQKLKVGESTELAFLIVKNNAETKAEVFALDSLKRRREAAVQLIADRREELSKGTSINERVALATFNVQSGKEYLALTNEIELAEKNLSTNKINRTTEEVAADLNARNVRLGAAVSLASSELSIAQSHYADTSQLRALRMQEIQANLALELSAVDLTQEQITAIYAKAQAEREGIVQQFPNAFEKAMQDVISSSSFSMGQLVNQFSGTMADWVMGMNTFKQFWKNSMRSLAQAFINEALANMAKAAKASGMGEMFGNLAGMAMAALGGGGSADMGGRGVLAPEFGGGASGGFDASGGYALPQFTAADGGIVTSPTVGLVGEAGPEAIIPLSQYNSMGGGGGVNIAITVNAGESGKSSGTGEASNFDQLARKISQMVEAKIIDEQRPGGLLSGMA